MTEEQIKEKLLDIKRYASLSNEEKISGEFKDEKKNMQNALSWFVFEVIEEKKALKISKMITE